MSARGASPERSPAVFVDRDGTIIRERRYLSDPDGIELLPGAVPGLRALHDAGYDIVIVTNQSGIARGFYDEAAYRRVQDELLRRLAAAGVPVLASYHCPHHPEITGPCDCRKPAAGLFERAAREHGLDPARSIFIGDRLRDIEAAERWQARAFLVTTGYGAGEAADAPPEVVVLPDLEAVAGAVVAGADAVDAPPDFP